jgi:hypothetical protein
VPILLQKSEIVVARLLPGFSEAVFYHPPSIGRGWR